MFRNDVRLPEVTLKSLSEVFKFNAELATKCDKCKIIMSNEFVKLPCVKIPKKFPSVVFKIALLL